MIGLLGLTVMAPAYAQEIDKTKALKVKAAYLFNFAKFIEWPNKADGQTKSPFVFGVMGNDSFGRVLGRTVRAKSIAGRTIEVRRMQWDATEDRSALRSCHILFIGSSERSRVGDIFAALQGAPTLLVSDLEGFARAGGMIGFVLEAGRIVFEINQQAIEAVGLKVSSKLLRLARIVESKRRTQR
ncbi:MAG: YfiR family protein [Phycisphaerae bacterium]